MVIEFWSAVLWEFTEGWLPFKSFGMYRERERDIYIYICIFARRDRYFKILDRCLAKDFLCRILQGP